MYGTIYLLLSSATPRERERGGGIGRKKRLPWEKKILLAKYGGPGLERETGKEGIEIRSRERERERQ